MLAPERLSHIIGAIYDCAIDPDRWPEALADICGAVGCRSGLMLLIDLEQSRHRFAYTWGIGSDWAKCYFDHADEMSFFYQHVFSRRVCPDGEPLVLAPWIEAVGPRAQQIYGQLTRPHGVSDMIQTVVLRQARRLAVLGANRHGDRVPLTDEERMTLRLLVPHVRRAVTILDLLDMKKIEADALAATLDSFTAGVVIVGHGAQVLHANDAARRMLAKGKPIAVVDGTLSARDPKANRRLREAIMLARNDDAAAGGGIGIPLQSEAPAVAHVLPLAGGGLRTRLVPNAIAAVFVTQAEDRPLADIGALGEIFGLTAAECRVLEHLVRGATRAETADALGLSAATVGTHLAHIFSKTGISREVDLIALMNRLVPPVRRDGTRAADAEGLMGLGKTGTPVRKHSPAK